MSTARARISRRGQSGYSLIEIIMVLAIVALMAVVVERTLASSSEAERYLGAVRKSTERGERLAYEVREIVSASRKLFGNDTIGTGYFSALDLSRDAPITAGRLPTFDETNGPGAGCGR